MKIKTCILPNRVSKYTITLLFLSVLPSSVCWASPQVENTNSAVLTTSRSSNLTALPPVLLASNLSAKIIQEGTQVSLNGRSFPIAWQQSRQGNTVRTSISDSGLVKTLGVELLSTNDWKRQPIQWFSDPRTPIILPSQLKGAYRYVDITDLAKVAAWQLQVEGNTLQISTVTARVENIRQGNQPWGSRLVVDLDRPTPWQVIDRGNTGEIILEASAEPSLQESWLTSDSVSELGANLALLQADRNQTTIRVDIPKNKHLQVFSLPNPNRLVIDLRPDALVAKDILWAPGIRWRQQFVNLGRDRFPVVWLEVDPRSPGLSLKPIRNNLTSQVGTTPLLSIAQSTQAAAAINGSFFNRDNQLPLGAMRQDGRWLSGPILNRGAIAWNDQGKFKIGRLNLTDTLIIPSGQRIPIPGLNTGHGYLGISRYTTDWGATYTPLADSEVILVVENERITADLPGGAAGEKSFPIPTNGYLLAIRWRGTAAENGLTIGTRVRLETGTDPAEFAQYPHILGAGPVLLQNRQIVVDATGENFSDAFAKQYAVRSVIGITPAGTLLIAAVHNRVEGRGPNLPETAQLMQLLGAIDVLNLDGGSSTGLYLGGQLLDRSPNTVARVHNGIGIFLAPVP